MIAGLFTIRENTLSHQKILRKQVAAFFQAIEITDLPGGFHYNFVEVFVSKTSQMKLRTCAAKLLQLKTGGFWP